jgi:hypothetical protein
MFDLICFGLEMICWRFTCQPYPIRHVPCFVQHRAIAYLVLQSLAFVLFLETMRRHLWSLTSSCGEAWSLVQLF